jgi:hypothetical protein
MKEMRSLQKSLQLFHSEPSIFRRVGAWDITALRIEMQSVLWHCKKTHRIGIPVAGNG